MTSNKGKEVITKVIGGGHSALCIFIDLNNAETILITTQTSNIGTAFLVKLFVYLAMLSQAQCPNRHVARRVARESETPQLTSSVPNRAKTMSLNEVVVSYLRSTKVFLYTESTKVAWGTEPAAIM